MSKRFPEPALHRRRHRLGGEAPLSSPWPSNRFRDRTTGFLWQHVQWTGLGQWAEGKVWNLGQLGRARSIPREPGEGKEEHLRQQPGLSWQFLVPGLVRGSTWPSRSKGARLAL